MKTDGGTDIAAGPVRARRSPDGAVRIGWNEADWFGPAHLAVHPSVDRERVHAYVRALDDEPVIVFGLEATAPLHIEHPDGFASPPVAWHFSPDAREPGGAPAALRAFGHQFTEFALPVFSDAALERWRLLPWRPAVVLPLGLVAPDGRTILCAPLRGFHEQVIAVRADKDDTRRGLHAGWHGDLGDIDPGFATELAVVAGEGARECFATWARLLRAASGVDAPARDSDRLGTHLSYWTDNGSAYWYRTAPGRDMTETIVAAVEDVESRGLPIGAVQLDSWWYPHQITRSFNVEDEVVPPTGMRAWEPRDDVFPAGIADVHAHLGRRPLVTHCRHLAADNLYRNEFPQWIDGDNAHPSTNALYERFLDQCVAWGVEVFEHDWLVECFLGVRELRRAGRAAAWQEGIDAALRARDLHAQWCMASPADFAQASRLRNITSIRTSSDFAYLVGPEVLWAWFLHTNVMARALGLWPYKDVFHSAPDATGREVEALLAALSAGPVGIGDAIGATDPSLVRRTCRADGALVRPDVPIAALDRAWLEAPVWADTPIFASARTQHTAGRWTYLLALNVTQSNQSVNGSIALHEAHDDLPDSATFVMYDWRTQRVEQRTASEIHEVELDVHDWDYRVLAPVFDCGVAVIGDPSLYATVGDARIADVAADRDGVTVTVLGAGERVTVAGWSSDALRARLWDTRGTRDTPVERDATNGGWRVDVPIGAAGWCNVRLAPNGH